MKLFKLGKISLDGTKIKANASKHKALSYGYAEKIEQQLKAEVQALTAQAESADLTPVNKGMDIPQEIARREDRLKVLATAKEKLNIVLKSALRMNRLSINRLSINRLSINRKGTTERGRKRRVRNLEGLRPSHRRLGLRSKVKGQRSKVKGQGSKIKLI